MKISQVAAQLYTLRDFTKTPADVATTLQKVRAIGYEAVQSSAVGPIDDAELLKLAKDNGLTICATHEGIGPLLDEPRRVPLVPPARDGDEYDDDDQHHRHEDRRRPLREDDVEHRTAAVAAVAHPASRGVGAAGGIVRPGDAPSCPGAPPMSGKRPSVSRVVAVSCAVP